MPLDLTNYLNLDAKALQLESLRSQVIAANIANADTPGYKARDINFRAALAQASGSSAAGSTGSGTGSALPMTVTNPLDLTATGSAAGPLAGGQDPVAAAAAADLKYVVPVAPSLDGNTVSEQLEEAAFAQNAVRYQATLTFLNDKLRMLMTAITGQ